MQSEIEPVGEGLSNLLPFYWRNDFVPEAQVSRYVDELHYIVDAAIYERHIRFAELWDEALGRQSFVEAFTDKCILG